MLRHFHQALTGPAPRQPSVSYLHEADGVTPPKASRQSRPGPGLCSDLDCRVPRAPPSRGLIPTDPSRRIGTDRDARTGPYGSAGASRRSRSVGSCTCRYRVRHLLHREPAAGQHETVVCGETGQDKPDGGRVVVRVWMCTEVSSGAGGRRCFGRLRNSFCL